MLVEKPRAGDSDTYKQLYAQWKQDTREQNNMTYPKTIKALSHGDGNGFSKGSVYTFNFTHETMLAGCYEGNNNNGHNRFVTYDMIAKSEKSPHGNGHFSLVEEIA